MTKTESKAIAKAFKRALSTLPDTTTGRNTSAYICDNIGWGPGDRSAARDIIAERINYSFSLQGWLKEQSEEIAAQVSDDIHNNSGRKMQAYRKAWLRELIKEFSS